MKKQLAVLAVLALASGQAFAQFYLGGGVSRSEFENQANDHESPSALQAKSLDQSREGYKLFAGYQFNRWLGVEGEYADLGSVTDRATGLPPGGAGGTRTYGAKPEVFSLAAVGTLNLNRQFALLGRAGIAHGRPNYEIRTGGGFVTPAANVPAGRVGADAETGYLLGIGAKWEFARNWNLRVDYTRYADIYTEYGLGDYAGVNPPANTVKRSIDTLGISVMYVFR